MPSGGARSRSGPPPDPNALRRDRPSDQAGWITLPAERTGPVPDWPLGVPPSPVELTHWGRAWCTPQATQWEANGQEVEVALYVRSLAEAELPGAAANLRNLVKQLQENLGLSYVGLQRFRWKIADSTAATATPAKSPAARPARGRSSSRSRLKVVSPPSE
jgi:hypothetical protein